MFISPDLLQHFSLAAKFAKNLQHDHLLPEHLVWAICHPNNTSIADSIKACGSDVETVREILHSYVTQHIDPAPLAANEPPQPTVGLSRLLSEAQKHAIATHPTNASPNIVDFWVAFLEDRHFDGTVILERIGVNALDVKNFLAHGTIKSQSVLSYPEAKVLESFGICLTERAKKEKLDSVIGRDAEIDGISLDLLRRRKRNVLLVGEPGVGKTAVVEGLAQRIASGDVPQPLKNKRIWSIDSGSLVAGTKFRGDFEERIKKIIQVCEENQEVILFIDEIHMLIGMGSGNSSSMDAANLLKPALARDQMQLLGATTEQESRQIFEKDRALRRRFIKRTIAEPDLATAEKMISAVLPTLQKHHNVLFSSGVPEAVVSLAKEHIRDLCLPDSAIDLLDHVGSRHQNSKTMLSVEHVVQTASQMIGSPLQFQKKKSALSLKESLNSHIFGQPEAIDTLYKNIVRAQAGLNHPDKPLGSFLFVGPTGVGKTELAKQLSNHMGMPLVRFDLSEYQESHSIARLIGSPPGYTGHEEGGQLTAALKKQPACVLLLDEFDKAHPNVSKLFLQALDYGTLTDGQGEMINLRKSIVIFTTNHGAETVEKRSIGFHAPAQPSFQPQEALKNSLPPEFRNRLSAIVSFQQLGEEEMVRVVSKFLSQVNERLNGSATIQFSQALCSHIAKAGMDKQMGARPLERWIDEHIKTPLAEALLADTHQKVFKLSWDKNKNTVFIKKPAPEVVSEFHA